QTMPAFGCGTVFRPPARQRRCLCRQLFADAGQCVQNRLGYLLKDGELADLIRDATKRQSNGLRIQRRGIGGGAADRLATSTDVIMQRRQEAQDVELAWVVVQDLVQ